MSWLYSRALVAEYLAEKFLDGEQCAPLNGSHTQQAYCAPDKMTVFSRLFRFGMTYKPLTENLGTELLTLYLADFRVKTFQLPEKVTDLMVNDQECGNTWRGWLAKYDPDSCSWKTAQCSLLGEEQELLATLPRWGMTVDGLLWEQPTLERRFKGTDCGLLPAPVATDYKGARTIEGLKKANRNERNSLRDFLRANLGWKMPAPEGSEVLMGWPQGWTDLKPLEMDKSHCVPQQHLNG
jgi:hypothetical protein